MFGDKLQRYINDFLLVENAFLNIMQIIIVVGVNYVVAFENDIFLLYNKFMGNKIFNNYVTRGQLLTEA